MAADKPRMAAIGTFDGVHLGHRSLVAGLNVQSAFSGYTPMIVTFDRHPLETIAPDKAPPLLMRPVERYDMLRQCLTCVAVIEFNDRVRRMTAAEFMTMLRDRYDVGAIYMGFNHRFGSDGLVTIDRYRTEAAKLGMEMFEGHEAEAGGLKVSSSSIRHYIEQGDVAVAAKCLGRPYRVVGTVTGGRRLGREIGFPTANILPDEPRQLIPASGVYACMATLADGRRYKAMVNIGVRPTVDTGGVTTIEANLLGFSGDLYGRPMTLDFIGRIRDERRFDSIAGLQAQLREDERQARAMLP